MKSSKGQTLLFYFRILLQCQLPCNLYTLPTPAKGSNFPLHAPENTTSGSHHCHAHVFTDSSMLKHSSRHTFRNANNIQLANCIGLHIQNTVRHSNSTCSECTSTTHHLLLYSHAHTFQLTKAQSAFLRMII